MTNTRFTSPSFLFISKHKIYRSIPTFSLNAIAKSNQIRCRLLENCIAHHRPLYQQILFYELSYMQIFTTVTFIPNHGIVVVSLFSIFLLQYRAPLTFPRLSGVERMTTSTTPGGCTVGKIVRLAKCECRSKLSLTRSLSIAVHHFPNGVVLSIGPEL